MRTREHSRPTTPRAPLVRAGAVALGCLALNLLPVTGVAQAATLNIAKAERSLKSTVATQTGAHVRSVKCPAGKEQRKGNDFTCTVTGTDGSTGKINVIQRDDEGHLSITAPLLHVRDAERKIKRGIDKQSSATHVVVKCPEIITAVKGRKVNCRATADGGLRARVRLTFVDSKGTFLYKVVS